MRLGGIKLWLDGSIPTAWFSEAYAHNPPDKQGDYRGFQQVPDDYVNGAFDRFWKTGIQLNMHMNGDAAAEQALRPGARREAHGSMTAARCSSTPPTCAPTRSSA